jgi:Na+(H+)/acetate symporter ActP
MLKKKLLLSLIVFQGILIVLAIIAIIFGVFYKYSNKDSSLNSSSIGLNFENIYLFDEKNIQQKITKNNQIILQIIDIKSGKIQKEIIIEK